MLIIKLSKNKKHQNNPILNVIFKFLFYIIKYSESLNKEKYILPKQISRSITSTKAIAKGTRKIGNKTNFIHKIKLTLIITAEYSFFLYENLAAYPNSKSVIKKTSKVFKTIISNSLIKL